jgi:uncharacterized protein (TIGR03435 family)
MLAVAAMLAAADIDAQRGANASADAAFELASIKRTQPGSMRWTAMGVPPGQAAVRPGGRFAAPMVTLRDLVRVAYDVTDLQVAGGPAWAQGDRFEIEALTRDDVTADEARRMLRRLLADRFKLAVHDETRELPVSILAKARDDGRLGPRLRPTPPECAPVTPPPFLAALPPPPPPPPGGPARTLTLGVAPYRCLTMVLTGHLSMRGVTMSQFASRLGALLERIVVDRTELAGDFDLDLTYAPDPGTPPLMVNGAVVTIDAPTLPSALREQLGLKIDGARAPTRVVVIDRAEAPTEN